MAWSEIANKLGLEALARRPSQPDVQSSFSITPRYSITEKSSLADVGSRSALVGGKLKVRKGSFKSHNGAIYTGIISIYGRSGFGQFGTNFTIKTVHDRSRIEVRPTASLRYHLPCP